MSDTEKQVDTETPPWLQPVPEDIDGVSDILSGRKALLLTFAIAVFVVIGFVAIILTVRSQTAVTDEMPRVAAEDSPVRVKPDDPGGRDIPHRDKQVLEVAAGQKTGDSQVRLGSRSEQPVTDIKAAAADSAKLETQSSAEKAPRITLEDVTKPAETETSRLPNNIAQPDVIKAEQTKAGDQNRLGAESGSESKEQSKEAVGAANALPEARTDSLYRIQLGAFSDQSGARAAWQRALNAVPDTLRSLKPFYEEVDTGSRVLYRLRVGFMETRSKADAACLAVRAKSLACLVVNPSASGPTSSVSDKKLAEKR